MRLLARIAGAFFILFGLGVLVAAVYLGTYQDSVIAPRPRDWHVVFGGTMIGLVFCAAGLYNFKAEASRSGLKGFRKFLAAHPRELKVFAYVGCAVSLVRLAVSYFGVDWPGRWVEWPLALGIAVLLNATSNAAQHTASRKLLLVKKMEGAVVMVYLLALAGIQIYPRFSQQDATVRSTADGMTHTAFTVGVAILYVLEAVYLSYRESRRDAEAA